MGHGFMAMLNNQMVTFIEVTAWSEFPGFLRGRKTSNLFLWSRPKGILGKR